MKYPSVYLMGERAHGEILSIAFAGKGQHQDAGGKIIHAAPNTTSNIFAKSISKDGGRLATAACSRCQGRARRQVQGRLRRAAARRAFALRHLPDHPDRRGRRRRRPRGHRLEGRRRAALLPACRTGIPEEEAAKLIVNGFIEPIVKELPMEYAVEMNRLIELQMEGSIGWWAGAWSPPGCAGRRRERGQPCTDLRLPSFRGGVGVHAARGWTSTALRAGRAGRAPDGPARCSTAVGGPGCCRWRLAAAAPSGHRERHLGIAISPHAARRANEAGGPTARSSTSRGRHVEAPISLTTVHAQAGTPLHHRTLIVLEEGAQAEVWHQSLSAEEADGVVNGVVELVVGQNAHLRFVDAQALSERTWVFGAQRAVVARRLAGLDHAGLRLGQRQGLPRDAARRPGRRGAVTGAYATQARQHLDFDTLQEHAAPDTTSDLAFRGILAAALEHRLARMIQVDEGAQRTDAFQESRNLLLSKKAHADAIPGLEILANDVRCTHAAAIAQIDPSSSSTWLARPPRGRGQALVIEGFLEALVDRFEEGPVRDAVAGAIERRLAEIL